MQPEIGPRPGWYDHGRLGEIRWWDGVQWTPAAAEAVAERPRELGFAPPALGLTGGIIAAAAALILLPVTLFFAPMGGLLVMVLAAALLVAIGGAVFLFADAAAALRLRRARRDRQAAVSLGAPRPAGWHEDAAGGLRWWDGAQWTSHVARRVADRPATRNAWGGGPPVASIVAGGAFVLFGVAPWAAAAFVYRVDDTGAGLVFAAFALLWAAMAALLIFNGVAAHRRRRDDEAATRAHA